MGSQWHFKNQYAGQGLVPKLTLVGTLHAQNAGHKVVIECRGDNILVQFTNFRSARKFRSSWNRHSRLPLDLAANHDLGILAQVGSWQPFKLAPDPSWIVKLLVPQLRRR
jgi:hypothetical protein